MSFKIAGKRGGWMVITQQGREMCFFHEEPGSHEGLKQALLYINDRVNGNDRQLKRLRALCKQ